MIDFDINDCRTLTWTDNATSLSGSLDVQHLYVNGTDVGNNLNTIEREVDNLKNEIKKIKSDIYGEIEPRLSSLCERVNAKLKARTSKDCRDPYENGEYEFLKEQTGD